ncbi:MAG: ATP-binding protein [Desulfovibrio sp.]|nr:MAG: ATP-binding protein [Desulfovibrio sp.]
MFNLRAHESGFDCVMSAEVDNVDLAASEVRRFLEGRGNVTGLFGIEIALREALLNAVMHGSYGNPAMSVALRLRVDEKALRLVVQDQGQGFSWRDETMQPPPPDESKGRGLAIMARYFDRVRFNDTGNCVEMLHVLQARD